MIHVECGRLQREPVIFSRPLCSRSISACLNTEEATLLQRAARFHLQPHLELLFSSHCMEISPLLIPAIYPDVAHASFFPAQYCEVMWARTSKSSRLLLLTTSRWFAEAPPNLGNTRSEKEGGWGGGIYEFTSTRPSWLRARMRCWSSSVTADGRGKGMKWRR